MKKIVRNVWGVLKEIASEIQVNWKLSQRVQGKSKKMRVFILIYMNIGFLLVYASTCFVSVLYILFGIIGGTILGIMESPYWLLLYLVTGVGLPPLYLIHIAWTKYYPSNKKEFLRKSAIQSEQGN